MKSEKIPQKVWVQAFEKSKQRAVSLFRIEKLLTKKHEMLGTDVVNGKLSPPQALARLSYLQKIESVATASTTPPEKIDVLVNLLK